MAQRDPFAAPVRAAEPEDEFAVFASRQAALRTFRALLDTGFSSESIRMVEGEPILAAPPSRAAEADAGMVRSAGLIGAVSGGLVGAVLCEVARTALDPGHALGPLAAAASGAVAGAALGGFTAGLVGAAIAQALARARAHRVPKALTPAGGATIVLSGTARCDQARGMVRIGGGAFPPA